MRRRQLVVELDFIDEGREQAVERLQARTAAEAQAREAEAAAVERRQARREPDRRRVDELWPLPDRPGHEELSEDRELVRLPGQARLLRRARLPARGPGLRRPGGR